MKKTHDLKRLRMKLFSLGWLLLMSDQVVMGQFSTAAPTSTTSTAPLTINGVYISRGNYQIGGNSYSCIGIGTGTLGTTTINSYSNTAIGVNAMNQSYDAVACAAFGTGALRYANGSDNTAVGNLALGALSNTGVQNVTVGGYSLGKNTTGSYNNAFGVNSMANITTGYGNAAFGHASLLTNATGIYNTAIGYHSLWSMSAGNNNTALGNGTLDNISTGNYNVAIGSGATVTNAVDYQLSIQNVIYGLTMSNAANGKIGIGLVPAATVAGATQGLQPVGTFAKLQLGGSAAIPSLRLNNVPSTTALAGRSYLFIDAAGIVTQAPISAAVNSVVNTISGTNALTTTVNGVASAPVTLFNLYSTNGIINAATTTGINRTVDMNDRNIWFNTTNSPTNGRLYIGANPLYPTNTGNYRLYVEGGILAEKVKIALRSNTTNWADYVFADDYKLMPLKTVAAFVKKNKHLPGINAAEDLVKNGLDLGEMQAKQMGKIEELTLYIIEQNNMLEKQQAQIEALKAAVETLLKKSK